MTKKITAKLWSKMPKHFHYKGKPNDWVKMTRPGQSLHSFLEGPCFDDHGNIWLVDVPYGRIFRINEDGKWHLHKTYDGEPHSIKVKDDNSFYLTDYKNGLLEYDGNDGFNALAVGYDGDKFKGLSDMAIAPNGDVWITDSGRTSLSDPTGNVYRYKSDGELVHILNNVPYPNGIVLSPDGKFVYVAATRANAVWRLMAEYPDKKWPMVGTYVQMTGGLGPDGLAVHENGNLAVAHAQAGRVYVYNTYGDTVAQIEIPDGLWVTSLIFQENTLYIIEAQTASIYSVELMD